MCPRAQKKKLKFLDQLLECYLLNKESAPLISELSSEKYIKVCVSVVAGTTTLADTLIYQFSPVTPFKP
jgi:hypothetical protein